MEDKIKLTYELVNEIEKWSDKYQFNIQSWGKGQNNIFLYKDDVELFSGGDYENINLAMINALQYIYRINRVPYNKRVC